MGLGVIESTMVEDGLGPDRLLAFDMSSIHILIDCEIGHFGPTYCKKSTASFGIC